MAYIVPLEAVPTKQEAQDIVKELASQDRVSWSSHCKQRMEERDVTVPEVRNCLEKGIVTEEPYRIFEYGGGYRVTMEKRTAGKFLKVILTLKYTQRILVVTTMWVGNKGDLK